MNAEKKNVMATVHLHGELGELFAKSYRLSVFSPREAVHALCMMLPGFADTIKQGVYECILGEDYTKGRTIEDASHLVSPWHVGETDFHIIPSIAGAGHGGGTKIIIGIAIIALAIAAPYIVGPVAPATLGAAMGTTAFTVAGFSISYGAIAFAGAMVLLGGIAMSMSPQPNYANSSINQNSWLFNNIENSAQEGGPIPYIYGDFLVGSLVIAEGMYPQSMPIYAAPNLTLGAYTGSFFQ